MVNGCWLLTGPPTPLVDCATIFPPEGMYSRYRCWCQQPTHVGLHWNLYTWTENNAFRVFLFAAHAYKHIHMPCTLKFPLWTFTQLAIFVPPHAAAANLGWEPLACDAVSGHSKSTSTSWYCTCIEYADVHVSYFCTQVPRGPVTNPSLYTVFTLSDITISETFLLSLHWLMHGIQQKGSGPTWGQLQTCTFR